jgi:predicted acylesterase/phospholipase RssA
MAAVALLGCLLMAAATGCATYRPRNAPPQSEEAFIRMPGFTNDVRTWGDVESESFRRSIAHAFAGEAHQSTNAAQAEPFQVDILAISGGAANGAYGAGFLTGWSQTGKRPRFKIVTGISTGALMAPFAFLGKEYDGLMSALYTNVTTQQIFLLRLFDLLGMFTRDHVADTRPLRQMVYNYYDEYLIERVAHEHRQGRRLFVGTTALDAQRPVIWDMGAIAASGHTNRSTLFREVLLASAAIPVAFPPVYLNVEANGKQYDEMHVDGGLINQVFIYDAVWDALKVMTNNLQRPVNVRLFVIRNNHLTADWQEVPARLVPIAKRSLATIVKSNSYGDLFRLYTRTREHGAQFFLTAIPNDHPLERKEEFDREAMRALYQLGYDEASKPDGSPWLDRFDGPPGGMEVYRPTPSQTTPPQPAKSPQKTSPLKRR